MPFLSIGLAAAVIIGLSLYYRKGARSWTVVRDDVRSVRYDEWRAWAAMCPYTYDTFYEDATDTIITFADGTEQRFAGRLDHPGGSKARLLRNRWGDHRLEAATDDIRQK